MSLKRLQTGFFQGSDALNPEPSAEVPSKLTKRAILCYEGDFESMDGPVSVSKDALTQLATNHNSKIETLSKLSEAEAKSSMKEFPPLQLDHSTSAKDTVGRMTGKLELGPYVCADGTECLGLYGDVTVLGKENVEKVLDGRWTHLSVGVDFEKGYFSELTITPFPAAPEASMLSKSSDIKKVGLGRSGTQYYWNSKNQEITDIRGNRVGKAPSVKAAEDFVKENYRKLSRDMIDDTAELSRLKDGDKELNYKGYRIVISKSGLSWDRTYYIYKDKKLVASYGTFSTDEEAIRRAKKSIDSGVEMSRLAKFLDSSGKWSDYHDAKMYSSKSEAEAEAKKIGGKAEQDVSGKWFVYKGKLDEMSRLAKVVKRYKIEGYTVQIVEKGAPPKASYFFEIDDPDRVTIVDYRESGHGWASIPSAQIAAGEVIREAKKQGKKLSQGGSMDKEKLKKHLMDKKEMSEEDADKHLAALSEEDTEKLSAEVKEDEDKLAAEEEAEKAKLAAEEAEKEEKEKEEKLSAARSQLTKLSAGFKAAHGVSQLAAAKGKILTRLAKLRSEAKITPAEIKKMDLDKLSKEGDKAIDLVLKTYENREPVIMTGVLGSLKADELHKLTGQSRMSRLEAETRSNMSLLRKTVKPAKKLSDGTMNPEEVNVHIDTTPHVHQDLEAGYGEMCKLMDEGRTEECKAKMKEWMKKSMSNGAPETEALSMEETEKQLSSLAESVNKMQTQFEELHKLTASLVGTEK